MTSRFIDKAKYSYVKTKKSTKKPAPDKNKYDWDTNAELRKAVNYIAQGDSVSKASRKSGFSCGTLRKFYTQNVVNGDRQEKCELQQSSSNKPKNMKETKESFIVFTPEQEELLMKCMKNVEYLFYGLSAKECRMLAYQMVINEDLKIPEGWKNGMASSDWLVSFKERHRRFMSNIEKPDRMCTRAKTQRFRNISIPNILWEKKTVNSFYDDLEKNIQACPELRENKRVYSLDETYTSIDLKKKLVDRERGDFITTCCFICADGTSLPPVIIMPFTEHSSSETPAPVEFRASHGKLSPDLFIEVMQHFIKHSQSTIANPSVLIMDTDICHLSSAALNLAKDSGVHVITIHPHVNMLLQPLQGELFDSFHKAYYEGMKSWRAEYVFVSFNFGKIVQEAYVKVMIPEIIQTAFKRCGVSPFDRDLFTEADYKLCLDLIEQTCAECRLRDDRFKHIDNMNGEHKKDEDEGSDVSESQPENSNAVPEKSTLTGDEVQAKQRNAESDGASMPRNNKHSSDELDKLKRRLIRSVARLIKEKKTEEEVWAELKKECGTNCKTLWVRMRSLTLKKLKRLLDAEDRLDIVPAVARMTLTDWLLYDYVLVHEKIDVINRSSNTDSKVMNNLFTLVERFEIEGLSGDELAEAWAAATIDYNSKGHQCSPMLMQRRWYQIKELTRHKLYKFWFNYRGNERLLGEAKRDEPTPLQRAIALRYPEIITNTFPDWDERIELKLIIMPEEFEVKMRKKYLTKPSDEKVPDVVIVEQKIDTITLDSDSELHDEENAERSPSEADVNTETDETTQTPIIVQVKSEPQDFDDNIDIAEHSVYPEESKDKYQEAIESLEMEEDRILNGNNHNDGDIQIDKVSDMAYNANVTGSSSSEVVETKLDLANNQMDIDISDDQVEPVSTDGKLSTGISTYDDNSQDSILIEDEDDVNATNVVKSGRITPMQNQAEKVIDITSPELKTNRIETNNLDTGPTVSKTTTVESSDNNDMCPIIMSIASGPQVEAKMEMDIDFNKVEENEDEEILDHQEDVADLQDSNELDLSHDIITETNFEDDGIEFADDGIEYFEERNDQAVSEKTPEAQDNENVVLETADSPKFDLKLLMNPVVYTTKLDMMDVYEGKSVFDTISNKDVIEKINAQSKPVSAQSINVQAIQTENQTVGEMVNADQVKTENNDNQEFDDNLYHNDSSDDENSINESKRVKLTSTMLQKPKSRSYNPIQLCKNPDFNTRLKRLNIGFFSYHRNRVFLKACKPMTIDLSKSFESKLINGTMYLKSSATEIKKEVDTEYDNSESAASVVPSAVAVQSLMDTTDVDKILQEELIKRMLDRNKTITLPNISLVRQINQHLLMAEVAPIMMQVEKSSSELMETVHDQIESVKNESVEIPPIETANAVPTNNVKEISPTSVTNAEKAEESTHPVVTDLSAQLLPVIQTATKPNDDNDKNKRPKHKKKTNPLPAWISKCSNSDSNPFGESLLTIDTLYKVLNALDPAIIYKPKPSKNYKLYGNKLGRPPHNKVQQAIDSAPTDKIVTDCTISDETQPSIDLTVSTDKGEEIAAASTSKKTTRKSRSRRNKYCCWSRAKIINYENTIPRCPKHRCQQGQCKCCCKEALRQVEIGEEIKLLERLQNREKYVDTIEEVVQQSRDISTNNNRNAEIITPINKEFGNNIEIISPEFDNIGKEVTIVLDDENKSTEPPRPVLRVLAGNSATFQRRQQQQKQIERPTEIRQQTSDSTINTLPLIAKQPVLVVEPKIPKLKRARHAIVGKKAMALPSRYSLKEPDAEELPCSCRPNVAVDGSTDARMLVVDGSIECKRHSTSRVSKETRIYLNRKHLSGIERPFFVGKNKILLTNIKPLRLQNKEPDPQPPVQPIPPVHPPPPPETPAEPGSLELPAGVQIVLLPDGTISYVVDPDVVLTQPQILAMPLILQAVQQQISATGYTLPIHDPPPPEDTPALENNAEAVNDSEIINLDDDNDSSHLSVQNVENNKETDCVCTDQVQAGKESLNKTTNDSDRQVENQNKLVEDNDKELRTEPVTIVDNEVNEVTDKTKDIENTNITTEPVNTTDSTAASSRNLLSDLMEMSGILEEDVSTVQEIAPAPTLAPENTESVETVEAIRPPSPHQTISAQINEQTYNLNAVVSFSELKYACENGGLFFKLDLNTGLIIPINVCIQKTQEPRKVTEDVIDLTDEPIDQAEAAEDENIVSVANEQMSIQIRPRSLETLIEKPSTRSVYVGTPRKSSIENKKKALMERLSNNLKPMRLIQKDRLHTINILKRNAALRRRTAEEKLAIIANFNDRVEANINLEDSDAPMEEEYLEESSDDDEPLAKVAKKMRANETNADNIEESAETAQKDIDFEEAIDAVVKSPPHSQLRSNIVVNEPPVPRQLMLSGNNQPIILNKAFLDDESGDDSQDDCILGV